MIRSVINCVMNLVLPLQCLDLNIMCMYVLPDGGNQIFM